MTPVVVRPRPSKQKLALRRPPVRCFWPMGTVPPAWQTLPGRSVSVETLYAVFGSKARLVRHLLDSAISGTDDYYPPAERTWVQEVEREFDARRKIALFATGVRAMQERVSRSGRLWSRQPKRTKSSADPGR